jgi:hypothetical protein
MKTKEYITWTLAICLLLWGPINYDDWTYPLLIRLSYLIALPVLTWFGLKLIWAKWKPSDKQEKKINIGLTILILIILIIVAVISYKQHNRSDLVMSLLLVLTFGIILRRKIKNSSPPV